MTLEQQVAKALRKHHRRFLKEYGWQDGIEDFTKFYAPFIAAAIDAAAYDSTGGLYDGALRALKGEA